LTKLERLRKLFCRDGSDGIKNATRVIEDSGGSVEEGWIYKSMDEVQRANEDYLMDAINFLKMEHDYEVE